MSLRGEDDSSSAPAYVLATVRELPERASSCSECVSGIAAVNGSRTTGVGGRGVTGLCGPDSAPPMSRAMSETGERVSQRTPKPINKTERVGEYASAMAMSGPSFSGRRPVAKQRGSRKRDPLPSGDPGAGA
jgi:hypothetical protein